MKQIIEESNHIYFLRFSASFLAIIYECECLRKARFNVATKMSAIYIYYKKFIHIYQCVMLLCSGVFESEVAIVFQSVFGRKYIKIKFFYFFLNYFLLRQIKMI